ncbi:MAG: MipA/OmpV family protein [Halioglobus sp.]|nr:MipA/OmpV family protein [Halioglobus sp.]
MQVKNLPLSGKVSFSLYDSANTFGDLRNPVYVYQFDVDGGEVFELTGIPAGEYALVGHYDENSNGRIDKNFIGIPVEPLAFSNSYRPKGPPSYSLAAFTLADEGVQEVSVSFYRPLGKRGRIGIGPGVIGRSSPYRGYDGNVTQVIPAIAYNGDNLQILGPNVQYGLLGSGDLRLAAIGSYRIGVYDEDDSDYLTGLGDRDSTLMLGLAVLAELGHGFELELSYQHDILDEIGGGEARMAVDKSFQAGRLRLTPSLGVNWFSEDLADHDFGVPIDKALPNRPAYHVDSTYTFDIGVGAFYEVSTDWLVVLNMAVEYLDDEITDSPIVKKDYVIKGFLSINYVF